MDVETDVEELKGRAALVLQDHETYNCEQSKTRRKIMDQYVQLLAGVATGESTRDKRELFAHYNPLRNFSTNAYHLAENHTIIESPYARTHLTLMHATYNSLRGTTDPIQDDYDDLEFLKEYVRTESKKIRDCGALIREQLKLINGLQSNRVADSTTGSTTWSETLGRIRDEYGAHTVTQETPDVITFVCGLPYRFHTSAQYRSIVRICLSDDNIGDVHDQTHKNALETVRTRVTELDDMSKAVDNDPTACYRLLGRRYEDCAMTVAMLTTVEYMSHGIGSKPRFTITLYQGKQVNIMGTTYRAEMFSVDGKIERFLLETGTAEERVYYIRNNLPIILNGVVFAAEFDGPMFEYDARLNVHMKYTGLTVQELNGCFMAKHRLSEETRAAYRKLKVEFIAMYNAYHQYYSDLYYSDSGGDHIDLFLGDLEGINDWTDKAISGSAQTFDVIERVTTSATLTRRSVHIDDDTKNAINVNLNNFNHMWHLRTYLTALNEFAGDLPRVSGRSDEDTKGIWGLTGRTGSAIIAFLAERGNHNGSTSIFNGLDDDLKKMVVTKHMMKSAH